MSQLIDSLKRLYQSGKLTLEQIESILAKGSISQEEFDYITETPPIQQEGTDLNGAES